MASKRTNTSATTTNFEEKLLSDETSYREFSLEDNEMTYEQSIDLKVLNTEMDKTEKGSTVLDETIKSHQTSGDLSSDSEIDFGFTLDHALKNYDTQAITESYMRVHYFLHSMKEKNPEKFVENGFDEEVLIDKKRLDEKFSYLNPNNSQVEEVLDTNKKIRIRTAGRGHVLQQTNEHSSRKIPTGPNLPSGNRQRFISQENKPNNIEKQLEISTTSGPVVLTESKNEAGLADNSNSNEVMVLGNNDSEKKNEAFENLKDTIMNQKIDITKENSEKNYSKSLENSIKGLNSVLPLNLEHHLMDKGRSRSLSNNLSKSRSSSTKSFCSKKSMFGDKRSSDWNQKTIGLNKFSQNLTCDHFINSKKGSNIQIDSQSSFLKNPATDLNNNLVNNQSTASISSHTKLSGEYFFIKKMATKRICENCAVVYLTEDKS